MPSWVSISYHSRTAILYIQLKVRIKYYNTRFRTKNDAFTVESISVYDIVSHDGVNMLWVGGCVVGVYDI